MDAKDLKDHVATHWKILRNYRSAITCRGGSKRVAAEGQNANHDYHLRRLYSKPRQNFLRDVLELKENTFSTTSRNQNVEGPCPAPSKIAARVRQSP